MYAKSLKYFFMKFINWEWKGNVNLDLTPVQDYIDIFCLTKIYVRSGIRTHAWRTRLRPERSALDRSAILTWYALTYQKLDWVSVALIVLVNTDTCT